MLERHQKKFAKTLKRIAKALSAKYPYIEFDVKLKSLNNCPCEYIFSMSRTADKDDDEIYKAYNRHFTEIMEEIDELIDTDKAAKQFLDRISYAVEGRLENRKLTRIINFYVHSMSTMILYDKNANNQE